MALGLRLDGLPGRVYCVLGDGELAEGQVWEAAMAAASFRVGGLTAIVDLNGVQATDAVSRVMDIGDVPAKFRAFGWRVVEIDGHDMAAITCALDDCGADAERPTVITTSTVKGKGVDFAPGVTVLCPADAAETAQTTRAMADIPGPVYMRVNRNDLPTVTDANAEFEPGRPAVLREGADGVLFATGVMVTGAAGGRGIGGARAGSQGGQRFHPKTP